MPEADRREIIASGARAGVLLPLVFREPFDYRVSEGMEMRTGSYVRVPFGRKSIWGVVWGEGKGGIEEKRIKEIEDIAGHLPPMADTMRTFIDWVSWYTLAPKGMVLKMALPVPEAMEPPKVRGEGQGARKKEAISFPSPLAPRPSTLSPDQSAAAAVLRAKLSAGFSVTVLDGVTGSGKTEVYFDAIAACMADGKQALVLLPEIALSIQWLTRFEERFGFAPVVWHSGISPAKKRDAWRAIAQGDAPVVVGARSALFLPFLRPGLLVVDEEHDGSYKQEDGVIYHARDMAVARARHERIPVILASATPSLETAYNTQQGRYGHVHLPARHGEAELPTVRLIDMRGEQLAVNGWLSQPLRLALIATLAQGRQAMLFMNRRGYAPLMLCRACGHRFRCPHCAAYLVLHRARGRMLCHHCGYEAPPPGACPQCRQDSKLIPFGTGVERIYEEVRALLPSARIALMTSDSCSISGGSGEAGQQGNSSLPRLPDTPLSQTISPGKLITTMIDGGIDILIGTQMIAKGHHFAGLAMVGVLDADMSLGGGDLRAGERTYQLLHQLAGRAGREAVKGEVWLQTYMPEHPVMRALAAGDRDRYMALEARMREEALMPPYGKLAAVIIEGRNEREVAEFARALVREAHQQGSRGEKISTLDPCPSPLILGPAPAPLSLLRGKYRYRVLIKASKKCDLQHWLAGWLSARKIPARIRVKIDVEPHSFL